MAFTTKPTEEFYTVLTMELANAISIDDLEGAKVLIMAMQELRLYINGSSESWSDEDLREAFKIFLEPSAGPKIWNTNA